MAHVLHKVEQTVNESHRGLGGLVATLILVAQARKCMLIIAPAGTGKSTATATVKDALGNVRLLDSVTRNGLVGMASEMNGFSGLISIDDLGKVDTFYSRLATITTFCELVYSHFVEKHAQGMNLSIADFQGSAVINCQPGVFRRVVQSGEWEATIMDKTLRYYHLYRPQDPERKLPKLPVDKFDSTLVQQPLAFSGARWETLFRLGLVQWSRARAMEHMTDYVIAAAALDGRNKIENADYDVVLHFLRPMLVERVLMSKRALEGERDFNANLLCLLVEFATYGEFSLDTLSENYKISGAVAQSLMRQQSRYVQLVTDSPTVVKPTPEMLRMLTALQVQESETKTTDGRSTRRNGNENTKRTANRPLREKTSTSSLVEKPDERTEDSSTQASGKAKYPRYSSVNRPNGGGTGGTSESNQES